jgi:molybdopterin-synthase adenylyltransferase
MRPTQTAGPTAEGTLLLAASECGLSEIVALGPDEVKALPDRHGLPIAAVRGSLVIKGQVAHLIMAAKFGWPHTLPLVFLSPWDAFGCIPHVDKDGFVCFAHEAGLIIDSNRPKDVACDAGEKAIRQIVQGALVKNSSDYSSEFEAYWIRQEGICKLLSFVEPSRHPKVITVLQDNGGYVSVCDRFADITNYLGTSSRKLLTQRNALFVPLPEGSTIVPPHPDQPWDPVEAVELLVESLDQATRQGVAKLCSDLTKDREFVVVYLPKPDGNGGTLFGLDFRGEKGSHPLLRRKNPKEVVPYQLTRRDRTMIQPRGGANTLLHCKRVAVIGCGSVGGFLAFELARAGIGNLTLLDPEALGDENTFRHVLGKKYVGKGKTLGLQEDMNDRIPYLTVVTLEMQLERAVHDGRIELGGFDAIVCTVGSPSTERFLNQLVHDHADEMPSTIYTWVEAYGLGGHVLVTNNHANDGRPAPGCLECLYTPMPNDSYGLHCRASFARPGQDLGRNISGCSGLFIPYGSTAAVKAAVMATEATVDVLLGKEEGNPLLSFKGSSTEFCNNGFELSKRFTTFSADELFETRYGYVSAQCPVCGGRP